MRFFSQGTFATTMTNMTAATFHSYALAQVDAPASSLLPHTLTMMEEEDEDDEPKPAPKIPKDVIVPLLAILACSFAGMLLGTFAAVNVIVLEDVLSLELTWK